MKDDALTILCVVFFIIGIGFVFLFPAINEIISGEQVERHTATVVTCDQEYRRSFLTSKSGETRYKFTVTATLEDGKEITVVEDNSFQSREYTKGEQITVYELKNHYKLERSDLFAPWAGNSEIMYIIVVVFAVIPIVISKLKRK